MVDNILTLDELSKYLKMDVQEIVDLVEAGEIPGIKIGNQWRFRRNSIDDWLENRSTENLEKTALRNVVNRFLDYTQESYIKTDMKARNRFEVLAEMAQFARNNNVCVKQQWLYDVLLKREQLLSTGIGNSIAFLHPRRIYASKIKQPSVLLGISRNGVKFRSPDDKPVNLFFLLLLKNDKQHLFCLSYLSQLFNQGGLREKILKEHRPDKILELLIRKK